MSEPIRIPLGTIHLEALEDALQPQAISARSWGIYVYLLSQPPGTKVSVKHLYKVFKEGRDAIYTALHNLHDAGLMELESYLLDGRLMRRRFAVIPPHSLR